MVEPGTGNVQALAQSRPMGRRQALGADLPQLRRAPEVRRLQRLPGRLDVQGVRPGGGARQERHPAETPSFTVPAQESIDMNQYQTCDGPYTSTEVWEPTNSTTPAAPTNLYTGTQNSVNTFFAQLELITGLCEPYKLAKSMGIDLARGRRPRAGPVVHPRRRRHQPARDGRGLRDLRGARPALLGPARHRDRGLQGQPAQGVPRALQPGAAQRGRRHRQRHPQGRHRRRAASASTSPPSRRTPARPAPPRTARPCGSWATPPTSPPPR